MAEQKFTEKQANESITMACFWRNDRVECTKQLIQLPAFERTKGVEVEMEHIPTVEMIQNYVGRNCASTFKLIRAPLSEARKIEGLLNNYSPTKRILLQPTAVKDEFMLRTEGCEAHLPPPQVVAASIQMDHHMEKDLRIPEEYYKYLIKMEEEMAGKK